MQASITAAATDVLTPSEVVLLNGDQFSRLDKNGFPLPRGGTAVDPNPLAIAALEAAILGNERAGAITLEQEIEKKLFGLLKGRVVRVRTGTAAPRWPEGSYEARICERVKKGGAEGITVKTLVIDLFPSDDDHPWTEVLQQIAQALRARGLADEQTREKKALGIFKTKSTVAVLNAAGASLAERHPATRVQDLLTSCQRERPEVWSIIDSSVRAGLNYRQESSDSYGSSSFD
ncbi:MAG TPA: hypothetical protein VK420_15660 [Longimicrobium sp.]|nr:hypothetical protein [Longimicrobium sp.]